MQPRLLTKVLLRVRDRVKSREAKAEYGAAAKVEEVLELRESPLVGEWNIASFSPYGEVDRAHNADQREPNSCVAKVQSVRFSCEREQKVEPRKRAPKRGKSAGPSGLVG